MPLIRNHVKPSSGGSAPFYPYTIGQSLRFNDDDSAYLSRTPSVAGNRKTWTWSAWVKRGNLGVYSPLFSSYVSGSQNTKIYFLNSGSTDSLYLHTENTTVYRVYTNAVFRDPSAWYHIVYQVDTTQAVEADRIKIWMNGEQQTLVEDANGYPAQNVDTMVNNTNAHYVGREAEASVYHDGYMTDVHFCDGTAYDASEFGELKNGVWIPKSPSVTYGTNGFYLDFADSGDIGNDVSGNNNDWTPVNLAATDVVLDSPTNNFCVFNPLTKGAAVTLSEGNLRNDTTLSGRSVWGSFVGSSNAYYWESYIGTMGSGNDYGVYSLDLTQQVRYTETGAVSTTGLSGVTGTGTFSTFTTGDIISTAYDVDNRSVKFYKNGTLVTTVTWTNETDLLPYLQCHSGWIVANFGQDSSFAGNKTAQGNTDDNGIGDFYYAPPVGYLALCAANLPEPAIGPNSETQADDHFNTVIYHGNGTTNVIADVGFQPDLNWIRRRDGASNHRVRDVIRGVNKTLSSNVDVAEFTADDYVDSFDLYGFTVSGNHGSHNLLNASYVSWNWKAGGAGVANTDGTIASTVSVNEAAGFSIVSYTGNGSNNVSVGHGLTKAPELWIYKKRNTTSDWTVHTTIIDGTKDYLELNNTNAALAASGNLPGSSVFYTAYSATDDMIAYCFHSVEGFSKIGSYIGNGSVDGTFVYCGFRPAYLLIKRAVGGTGSWFVWDKARNEYNTTDNRLFPDLSNAEGQTDIDFLSNGFKLRTTSASTNTNGSEMIYMAFAENPFKYSNAR